MCLLLVEQSFLRNKFCLQLLIRSIFTLFGFCNMLPCQRMRLRRTRSGLSGAISEGSASTPRTWNSCPLDSSALAALAPTSREVMRQGEASRRICSLAQPKDVLPPVCLQCRRRSAPCPTSSLTVCLLLGWKMSPPAELCPYSMAAPSQGVLAPLTRRPLTSSVRETSETCQSDARPTERTI